MKESLLEFGMAAALNATLLGVAFWEFRRHGIEAKLLTPRCMAWLFVWTICEVAIGDRYNRGPFVYAALMGSIGVSVATDGAEGYILDVVTIPSCAFAIVAECSRGNGIDPMIGALAASGSMFLLFAVTRGQGLGLGDVKLAAVIGALQGAEAALISLGCAFVLGGCVAAVLILSGYATRKMTVPFAPYIAAGTLTVLTFARA